MGSSKGSSVVTSVDKEGELFAAFSRHISSILLLGSCVTNSRCFPFRRHGAALCRAAPICATIANGKHIEPATHAH